LISQAPLSRRPAFFMAQPASDRTFMASLIAIGLPRSSR
jgi:hypothetical protein